MQNLFSIFDPVAIGGLSLNWVSSLAVLLFWPMKFWLPNSQVGQLARSTQLALFQEFRAIIGSMFSQGMLNLSIGAFIFIWLNNFLGLSPYVFTGTSHLVLTLALALPLWVGHVVLAWVKSTQNMLAHLVPLGSPAALSPFMVLIELVSAVIRPVTLSVRLAANMVAGHLLMVLLSSPACSAPLGLSGLIVMALVLLGVLESAVATIQAYVFSILSVLYVNEVNSPALESKTLLKKFCPLKA